MVIARAPGTQRMLTPEQARSFARNGFVVLPGLVPASTCAHLVERTWSLLPSHWRRDDPSSWRGDVADSCHVGSLDQRCGLIKFQLKDLGDDPAVVAAFQSPSPVHDAAFDLIGTPLHRIRVRGLYAIAPAEHPDRLPRVPSPHVEGHAAQIVGLCYLDDVCPGGGGLLVWPGSHRELYPAFDSKLDHAVDGSFASRVARLRRFAPLELPGGRGDVLLTHHRLLHSPSVNRSTRIRFAFLCDYLRLGHELLCRQRPGPDLWEDWPGLVARTGGTGLDGGPDHVRRPAPREPGRRAGAGADTPSARNKADASRILRDRRPGEIWVSLSDSPAKYGHGASLNPVGGEIGRRGVRVRVNGRRVASRARSDVTAPVPIRPGPNRIEITGVTGPLWFRMIEVRLPFADSRVLLRREIDGRAPRVAIDFDLPADLGGGTGRTDGPGWYARQESNL